MKPIILIVDGSKNIKQFLQDVLKDRYEVLFASNNDEMLGVLADRIPDLIFMDIIIPLEKCLDFISNIYKIDDYKNIPVILFVDRDGSEELVNELENRNLDYIKKPVDVNELRARIQLILKIKELENEIKFHSITDYLTCIYNRKYFFEIAKTTLDYSVRTSKKLCLAIFDVDFFKRINETYGNDAGDFILKEFADLIKQNIRQYDILARYSGEEFVLLLPDCKMKIGIEILSRIKDTLAITDFDYNGQKLNFTFSAGLVSLDKETISLSIDELVFVADKRLSRAKNSGRNTIVYIN
jgi:two-component system, cell cycle response regulator